MIIDALGLPTIRLLLDPTTSYWLCNAVRDLCKRDPVDAVADAEALAGDNAGTARGDSMRWHLTPLLLWLRGYRRCWLLRGEFTLQNDSTPVEVWGKVRWGKL